MSAASTTVGGIDGDPGPIPSTPGAVTTCGSTSATFHGRLRVGCVEVSTRPAESTATHSSTEGQARAAIAVGPNSRECEASIWGISSCHLAPAPASASVEAKRLFAPVIAKHSDMSGQDTASTWEPGSIVLRVQAPAPAAGSVELSMLSAPHARQSFVDGHVTALSAAAGRCAPCHVATPPDGSALVTMPPSLSTATQSSDEGQATPVNSTEPGRTRSGADHEIGDAALARPVGAKQAAAAATQIESAALPVAPGRGALIAGD